VDHQHNWQLLPFILIIGLAVGWATGQLVSLLIPTAPVPPQALPLAGGPAPGPLPSFSPPTLGTAR
jgi:hypothetical protein